MPAEERVNQEHQRPRASVPKEHPDEVGSIDAEEARELHQADRLEWRWPDRSG